MEAYGKILSDDFIYENDDTIEPIYISLYVHKLINRNILI